METYIEALNVLYKTNNQNHVIKTIIFNNYYNFDNYYSSVNNINYYFLLFTHFIFLINHIIHYIFPYKICSSINLIMRKNYHFLFYGNIYKNLIHNQQINLCQTQYHSLYKLI